MGIILSRFRKKKTTIEILEDLDMKIKEIERYGLTTEQRQKKIVGTLILYSVVLYIISAFIFYFCFFPASLYDQIFYIIPLLIFPILILLTKKLVTWYYRRKISENQEKLSEMQLEKNQILDKVTETETYKKAKEILLKFAPDQLKMTPLTPQPPYRVSRQTDTPQRSNVSQNVTSPMSDSGELRRRVLTPQNQPLNVQSGMPANTGLVPVGIAPIRNTPVAAFQSNVRPVAPVMGYRSPLPRPVLRRERSYLDRLIDYIVGDGPANRYALICRQCESHNGMALKEEFEYFGFKCCYCNSWNPARKQKFSAPRLDVDLTHTPSHHSSSSSNTPEHALTTNMKLTQVESSSPSDTDSDIEVVERPTESEDIEHTTQETKNCVDEPDAAESEKEASETNEKCEETVEKMDVDESFS
ncbi:PREDICTED: protein lunapark-A [Dufourea novaeangliae]|uniref:protein lunapark-A n=1 Tax=Dufourea novaeangliae TaxID=178035 RepID=UPI0007672A1E|nr:PREDICTED: protein lunapark-A [Dufourea novaeangliae]